LFAQFNCNKVLGNLGNTDYDFRLIIMFRISIAAGFQVYYCTSNSNCLFVMFYWAKTIIYVMVQSITLNLELEWYLRTADTVCWTLCIARQHGSVIYLRNKI